MRKPIIKSCYVCGKKATSREHVPPLCLFPEKKDIGHDRFRTNLITVPSCDMHNLIKTQDDEFLMACMAGVVGNNYIGYFHTKTKVNRALRRKKQEFLAKILRDPEEFIVKTKSGIHFPLILGHPDYERMITCFKYISLGLYFHEFRSRFNGECKLLLEFIKYKDDTTEKLKEVINYKYRLESKDWQIKGANPEIFQYQFGKPDIFGLFPLKMVFYEGAVVYVSFVPKNSKIPFDLGMELINNGIKTIVKLDNGRSIEFN